MSSSSHDSHDSGMPMGAGLGDRLRRVYHLDTSVFEEVSADASAIQQALTVVAVTSLIVGLGSFSFSGIFGGMAWAIVMWLASSGLVWLVANALSDDPVRYAALLRGLGFAYAWFALFLLGELPLVGWLVQLAALVLTVIAGVFAVRACMHVTTGRAAVVCGVSILAPLLLLRLIF